MFDFLYQLEPEMSPAPVVKLDPPSLLRPSTILTHPSMYRALDISEVTALIRRELCGIELKSMVLVNNLWWKSFGPYLWENIYIDADPEQNDCQVIFRNGLAARCLTLSIYDPQDSRGVVAFVAEKCRNISHLHLKLFSPDLVAIDEKARRERIKRDDCEYEEAFALEEETTTALLDDLFSALPSLSELTLSIAHEDIRPELVWCVTKLPGLRKLTINGGLRSMDYMVRKNWRCDWSMLVRIARECALLESLSVAWENSKLVENEERSLLLMKQMFQVLESTDTTDVIKAAPANEQARSLKWLSVSFCELYDSLLDVVYQSCPNLCEVEFKSVRTDVFAVEKHIQAITKSCPSLRSFKLHELISGDEFDYAAVLLDGPLLRVSSLKLQLGATPRYIDNLGQRWSSIHSITDLTLYDVNNYELLFKIISTMTGLMRLTLSGFMPGVQNHPDYGAVEDYHKHDNDPSRRLPEFASQGTLQFLDVTRLEFYSRKCHQLFFDRVQSLPQLRRLEISHRQLQDASLEETWANLADEHEGMAANSSTQYGYPHTILNPDLIKVRRRLNYMSYGVAYAHTRDCYYGPEGEYPDYSRSWEFQQTEEQAEAVEEYSIEEEANRMATLIPDKIFRSFPAVEFLYILDDQPTRYYLECEHYISEHIASAVVQAMPKLRVMRFDRALGEGLRRVQKVHPHVIFECIG